RLRGNDGGAVSVFSGKYPQAKILLFSQKQKTKNSNLKFVIPARAGIQFFEFQSFPINCLSIECLDSRLRGNDGFRDYSVSRRMGNGGSCVKNAV
ncbi:hypothetical protein, partial [Neisseria meningitidis]|uniref:hypothetical protein n=1 Tax=Neisseria meningitidis TaxID=487 RepID=UPI00195C0E18